MTGEKYRPRCFLDIDVSGQKLGRVTVELFSDVCPITCENFRALCTGEKGNGKTTSKPLHYKGVLLHRVIKNFMIQGGDFVAGNGTGGESIYGGAFKDENFEKKHDKSFLLSMANRGKDTNGSQFFITTQPAPHLDGKHTVFGHVIEGQNYISEIEQIATDQNSRPLKDVCISNCGELVLKVKPRERSKKKDEILSDESSRTDDTDTEETRDKSRKKKKQKKHSKKHKRERKESRMSSNERPAKHESDDKGLNVDPEEIPSVPTNNFLMRRTSPLRDDGSFRRSMRDRESFSSYQSKPSRSRSGRKIKGRGFMRYRTPSPTGSRSGSETPPHWKQAQSRLRNIKDVVTKNVSMPSDGSQSPENSDVEMEENNKNAPLQSRLGMVRNNLERDTREENEQGWSLVEKLEKYNSTNSTSFSRNRNVRDRLYRRNRDSSPRQRSRSREPHNSPLRSKVVMKNNFNSTARTGDRYRKGFERNKRGSSPDGKGNFHRDRGNQDNRRYSRRGESENYRDNDQSRKRDSNETKKDVDKHNKNIDLKKKSKFKSLGIDLARYKKGAEFEESSEGDDKKVEIVVEPVKRPKSRIKNLGLDLLKYQKDAEFEESTEDEQKESVEPSLKNKVSISIHKQLENTVNIMQLRDLSNSKSNHLERNGKHKADNKTDARNKSREKEFKKLELDLFKYRKDIDIDSDESDSDSEKTSLTKSENKISEINSIQLKPEIVNSKMFVNNESDNEKIDSDQVIVSNFERNTNNSKDQGFSNDQTQVRERSEKQNLHYIEQNTMPIVIQDDESHQYKDRGLDNKIEFDKSKRGLKSPELSDAEEYCAKNPDTLQYSTNNVVLIHLKQKIAARDSITKIKLQDIIPPVEEEKLLVEKASRTGYSEKLHQNQISKIVAEEDNDIEEIPRDENFMYDKKKSSQRSRSSSLEITEVKTNLLHSPRSDDNIQPIELGMSEIPYKRADSITKDNMDVASPHPSAQPRTPDATPPRIHKKHSLSPAHKSPSPRRSRSPLRKSPSKSPITVRSSASRRNRSPHERKSRSPVSRSSPSPKARSTSKAQSRRSASPKARLERRSVSPKARSVSRRSVSPKVRSESRRSASPKTRKYSSSPKARSVSRRSKSRSSHSRSKSRQRSRSPIRNRNRGRYGRSPDTRARRSWSRNRSDNRSSRFFRRSGMRNRSRDRRGSYLQRRFPSPSYRGRRGRSNARRSRSRSRSRSVARRSRRARRSSSSSKSSSSRNSSSSRSDGKKKGSGKKNARRSKKSSSSSSSERSKRSSS